MSHKKAPLPYDNDTERELYDNLLEVASATECTGLIPASPENAAETASYSDIYDVPLAAESGGAKRHSAHQNQSTHRTNGQKPRKH